MRFRLTIFLILANAALFLSIWILERKDSPIETARSETVPFTVLEISGKSLDKPRILKLDGNKWRIVSPIDWPANLFAVNRINSQLAFLDKETSFPLSEVSKFGHTLKDYGLEDPAYTFRYGNGRVMYTLKIGNALPIGDRVYMLDENNQRIIIADKEFVEGLKVDMERFRNQDVFDIPRFEVTAFSVRLPALGDQAAAKANFRRIGLVRDGGKWKFETPIVAEADPREVDDFLNDICQITARSFVADSSATGFDISALPATITLQGTNRRQVLILGGKTKDGKFIYAKLEDNPTVFTLDADIFEDIGDIQTALREKSFLRFDSSQTVGIDVSRGGKGVKLRKLKSGVWDVIGANAAGDTLTANADLAVVNDLIAKLEKVRARQFVNDAPGEDLSSYGLNGDVPLRVIITQTDQTSKSIAIGASYKYGAATLMYADADGGGAIYGITRELSETASTDFLHYRSRILEILPEKAVVDSVRITDVKSGAAVFEASSDNGNFDTVLASLKPREAEAFKTMLGYCKKFTVGEYAPEAFASDGVKTADGTEPWALKVEYSVDLPGSGASVRETRELLLTRRLGGTLQYGGNKKADAVFSLPPQLVDALFELTQERFAPEEIRNKTEPVKPHAE